MSTKYAAPHTVPLPRSCPARYKVVNTNVAKNKFDYVAGCNTR